MKVVVFDGYWMCKGPPSGVNVLNSLVYHWATEFPEDQIQIYIPSKYASRNIGPKNHNIEYIERRHVTFFHALWVIFEMIPLKNNYDYLITQNFTPLRGKIKNGKKITFIHDVIYMRHPEWFSIKERLYLHLINLTLRFSDALMTSSKTEASHIKSTFPNLAQDTFSVGLDVPMSLTESDHVFSPSIEVGRKPFILSVGRLNVRKNLEMLIKACHSPRIADEYDLYIVGERNGKAMSFAETGNNVRFLGSVTDSDLKWLYLHAKLFVFPSLDEGFGLPLAESNYFQTPSIASDIPVFREIGTSLAFFDPLSVSEIANQIWRVINSDNRVEKKYFGNWNHVLSKIRESV
jgi:glycosyltransferase involved in cell wall biosynthesis